MSATTSSARLLESGNEQEELVPAKPGRALMYTLVSLQGLPHWTIRSGLPAWVPVLVAHMGLSETQRAMLLAAWFPGYIVSQIPGAALIQIYGPKLILGLTMVGTCGVFMLLPWLAQLGRNTAASVRIMAACLTVCGFCQGPLIPGQMVMRRNWLPKSGAPSRPIHTKLMQLGGQCASIFATVVTPWLATRFGWRSVNTLMGGGGLLCCALWFAKATDKPLHYRRKRGAAGTTNDTGHLTVLTPAAAVAAEAVKGGGAPESSRGVAFNFGIFRDPAVIAALWCKMANGNVGYTMSSYTPTIFIESLGCTYPEEQASTVPPKN